MASTAMGLVAAMLHKAGVAHAQTNAGTAEQLPAIQVQDQKNTGYIAPAPSLYKLNQPMVDTPQSIDVVPRQLMDDQGVTTMRDALRNVTGVSLAAGEGGSQGDSLTLRGFNARGDIYLDGMRDFGSYYRDPFFLENIEVLKGPSSILFGRGSTGGVIEQTSKQPRFTPSIDTTTSFGTDGTKRVTADVNEPLPWLANSAVRVNLMAHDSNVAGRDVTENSRFGIAPTVALGMGTDTRTNFSYLHQTEYDIPDYGLPWVYSANAGSGRGIGSVVGNNSGFYGFTQGNYLRTNVDVATGKIEHDINNNVTFRDQLRYGHYIRDFRITEPQIYNPGTNTAALVSPSTQLGTLNVTRNQLYGTSLESVVDNQSDITANFKTWELKHDFVGGIQITRETSDPKRYTTAAPFSTTPLFSPNPGQPYNANAFYSSNTKVTAWTQAAYAMDTLHWDDNWDFIGGARYDRFSYAYDQTTFNAGGGQTGSTSFNHTDLLPSYRVAIVYKPAVNGSIYFDYGTSFNPSAEQLSVQASNASLAPTKSRTYEVGTKWNVFNDAMQLRSALYRTEQYNVRETDPNNANQQILAGNARVDGFEVEAAGHVTDKWQIYAGYTYMFSEITSSPTTDVGNRLGNVPMHSGNFWTTYDLPLGFQVGGGINYVSSRYAASNPRVVGGVNFLSKVPEYWTMQLMAKYQLTAASTLQLNIYNVLDTFYYDQIHPSHVVPGPGRSAMLTYAMHW